MKRQRVLGEEFFSGYQCQRGGKCNVCCYFSIYVDDLLIVLSSA